MVLLTGRERKPGRKVLKRLNITVLSEGPQTSKPNWATWEEARK